MATVKLRFRPSSVPAKEGSLAYLVMQGHMTKQIKTGCKLSEEEWNGEDIHAATPDREQYIDWVKSELAEQEKRILYIIKVLEHTFPAYTANDVIKAYTLPERQYDTFITFTRNVIASLHTAGKVRTAETYKNTLNSFMRFRNGRDFFIGDMDSDIVAAYETYMKSIGLRKNTSSFYIGILRAIYNRAVSKGLIVNTYPFKNAFTGMDKTVKRAIDAKSIHRIITLDLRETRRYDFARDMFLFSFYTRGMSFVDMAYLKKKNLKNGTLSYNRQKSGQQLLIRWEDCMQHIVDKYDMANSPYLLPIITTTGIDERKQYLSKIHNVNRNLRKIGQMIGLGIPLTLYVARHSWATIAYNSNIPVSVISEGLGHDSEKMTRIYLSSLDTGVIDNANRMILESVQKGIQH